MLNAQNETTLVGSVKELPAGVVVKLNDFQVLDLEDIPDEILSLIQGKSVLLKHLIYECTNGVFQYAILEKYCRSKWIKWQIENLDLPPFKSDQISSTRLADYPEIKVQEWNKLDIPDFMELWKEDRDLIPEGEVDEEAQLDMKPPDINTEVSLKSKKDTMQDPNKYLERKYYEALFSIRMPLAYFVKSNLVRLKNLCKTHGNPELAYRALISGMLLDIPEFDKRHDIANFGSLKYPFPQQIAELRDTILRDSYHISVQLDEVHPVMKDLVAFFKIREIKLQIIMLLELISMSNMDAKLKNFEKRYTSKFKARAINVTRAGKFFRNKKMNNHKRKPIGSEKPELDFCEKLDLMVDKLCIADILLSVESTENIDKDKETFTTHDRIIEHRKNILNGGKEASSLGFISYVLVPYYNRKTPYAVELITRKIKGPDLKSTALKAKRSGSAKVTSKILEEPLEKHAPLSLPSLSRQNSLTSIASTLNSSTPSPCPVPPTIKRHNSTVLPALLNSRTSSNLGEFLESEVQTVRHPSLVSRTKSDMSFNRLQKRQLSVNDLTVNGTQKKKPLASEKSQPMAVINGKSIKLASGTSSFQRVGKRKSESTRGNIETAVAAVQVMATPHGKKLSSSTTQDRNNTIVASPLVHNTSLVSSELPLDTIKATPIKYTNIQRYQSASTQLGDTLMDGKMVKSPQLQGKKVRRRLFAPE